MRLTVLILLTMTVGSCEAQTTQTAKVTEVRTSGTTNNYTFHVTLSTPDTGCTQYADWWEIMDLNGNLIYRRILQHSHVDEQPFTRSGGDVLISDDQEVWVRVHMNNSGYSKYAMKGSVNTGFVRLEIDNQGLGAGLEKQEPVPKGCRF